jgi:ankyrin repeat protein
MSALVVAVIDGDLEIVKQLVAKGADVKNPLNLGCTPLLSAAAQGHIPIMQWLLTEGGSSLA